MADKDDVMENTIADDGVVIKYRMAGDIVNRVYSLLYLQYAQSILHICLFSLFQCLILGIVICNL